MKEPSEEAKELIEKFKKLTSKSIAHSHIDQYLFTELSKQCALICVDQIIEAIDWHPYKSPNDEFKFWGAVKKHIEEE